MEVSIERRGVVLIDELVVSVRQGRGDYFTETHPKSGTGRIESLALLPGVSIETNNLSDSRSFRRVSLSRLGATGGSAKRFNISRV